VAASPRPGFRYDPRYTAPLFITSILLIAHFYMGGLKSPMHTGAAIAAALLTEAVLGRIMTGKVPHLASAYVSGISAGILIRTEAIWPFALCGAIAIASKYVLRWRGRHLWNPTNFAIAALLIVGHGQISTLGADFGNSFGPAMVIWVMGAFILYKLRRLHQPVAFFGALAVFALLRTALNGRWTLEEFAPMTGPMYQLFAFFMITDPKTTVTTKRGQIIVVILVAAMETVFRLLHNTHAAYYALFTVGPIANVIELWWLGKKKAVAAPDPARSQPQTA
jgi:Na+-translocating ferredoxin:NAD+ oxidoreductase RnfD subunit